MYTKLCNIHHHIVSICRSMALIFVTLFCSLWQPSYISDAIRLQMRLNKHWYVAWNMKWYWLIVLYIKVRTVHLYWIYFHTSFKLFQPLMNSEITSLIYSHTERLYIFSSILIIVTSNSRNASKFILFSM